MFFQIFCELCNQKVMKIFFFTAYYIVMLYVGLLYVEPPNVHV